MFKAPFSFNGRIRRTEYGLSLLMYLIFIIVINDMIAVSYFFLLALAYIPGVWFLWAQGAKRCHDVGNNGWWQIIPFYFFWLLFEEGGPGENGYGDNPKGIHLVEGKLYQGVQYTQPTLIPHSSPPGDTGVGDGRQHPPAPGA